MSLEGTWYNELGSQMILHIGVVSRKPRNVRTLFEFSQTTDFDKDIENLVTSINT